MAIDQAAPFRSGLTGLRGRSGFFDLGEAKLSDSGFHEFLGDSARPGFLHGQVPGGVGLFGGKAYQGPDLALVLGCALVTNCHQKAEAPPEGGRGYFPSRAKLARVGAVYNL